MTQQFSLVTIQSEPLTIGKQTIQIESKRLTIPFPKGGAVFQTPTAVYNTNTNERLPILDITRIATLGLLTIGAFLTMLFWWRGANSQKEH